MTPEIAEIPSKLRLSEQQETNQLELGIKEIEQDFVEGCFEIDDNFEIVKCDNVAASILEIKYPSKEGESSKLAIGNSAFTRIRKNLSKLQTGEAKGESIHLTIDERPYDIRLSKIDESRIICRIREEANYNNFSPSANNQTSPLLNTGLLLWTMKERDDSITLLSPPHDFFKPLPDCLTCSLTFWVSRIHPEDQNHFRNSFESLSKGSIDSFHLRYRIKDDKELYSWISTIASKSRSNPSDSTVSINGVHINENPIPTPNNELRFLSHLGKRIRIPVSINDPAGCSIWTNNSFYSLLGYKDHELKSKNLFKELSGPLTQDKTLRQISTSYESNEVFNSEIVLYHSNGSPIWCKIVGKPMLSPTGSTQRYLIFLSDITEYKKAENATYQNQIKFSSLFENSVDTLLIVSLKTGRIIESNASARAFFKVSNLFDQHIGDITSGKNQLSISEINKSLRGQSVYTERLQLDVDDKTHYTVDLRVRHIDSGQENTALLTIRNLTEELYLEEQLLHSQRMQAVGKLAGGVAHDFNNLLSGIKGFAELIENSEELSEHGRIYLKELLKTSDRATKLTSRLLSFSRQRSDKPQVADLNVIVNNISPMLSRILQQDIHFKITIGQNACYCLVDSSQIEQAIMNLVVNAQEATAGANRFIELRTYSKTLTTETKFTTGIAKPGDYQLLEVTDNGHGMSPEIIERIFEPFFTTKEGAGTGLGLAIAYSIVNKSNGFANIESTPGLGTRFTLIFPNSNEKPQNTDTSDSQNLNPFSKAVNKRTILVSEDEDSLREILQISLENIGHNLHIAKNGVEALELYKKYGDEIDLVLSDSVMPLMGGSELAQNIRQISADQPIIIMSGLPEEELFKDTDPVEINAFIGKPFSIKDLIKLVEDLFVASSPGSASVT